MRAENCQSTIPAIELIEHTWLTCFEGRGVHGRLPARTPDGPAWDEGISLKANCEVLALGIGIEARLTMWSSESVSDSEFGW
jgi:hypothetical protein